MNDIALVRVEAMSVAVSDKYAQSRAWEYEPIAKDPNDFARFVKALPGKRVLDLGCGYGMHTPDFMKAGLDYLGIDNSPNMIREARKDNPKAHFQIMSLNRMMFPDESFDGIWSCCSITTTPKSKIKGSIEKMRRLLTPHGVMMAVVPNFGFPYDDINDHPDGAFWYSIYTPDEFRELFRSCGFQVIGFWEDEANRAMSVLAKK